MHIFMHMKFHENLKRPILCETATSNIETVFDHFQMVVRFYRYIFKLHLVTIFHCISFSGKTWLLNAAWQLGIIPTIPIACVQPEKHGVNTVDTL